MPRSEWKIGAYDLEGTPIGPLVLANGREWEEQHNGIHRLSFGLRLDHPLAREIEPLATVVKLWRRVGTPGTEGYYESPSNQPDFAGVVAPLSEQGAAMTFNFTAFSPQWRLERRFVRELRRYDQDDQSFIMWDLIDYTNAFGYTGISLGGFSPTVDRDRTYEEDSQIWQMLVNMTGVINGPDIVPTFYHQDGDPTLMLFSTVPSRGVKRNTSFMHFRTGRNNLSDLTREFDVEGIGTRVKAVGSEDGAVPYAIAEDPAALLKYGLYEKIVSFPSVKLEPTLQAHADAELQRSKAPLEVVQPVIAPGSDPIFKKHFNIGDVVPIRGKRGRLDTAVERRIYGATIRMSELNFETATVQVGEDYGKTVEDDDGTGGGF